MKARSYQWGFTLVELLIVVAIIGILVAITMVGYSTSRGGASDARRVTEIRTMQEALEQYYYKYAKYPCGITTSSITGNQTDTDFLHRPDQGGTGAFLNSDVIPPFTCDDPPTTGLTTEGLLPPNFRDNSDKVFVYDVTQDRQKYILYVRLTENPDKMLNDGGVSDCFFEDGNGVGTMAVSWSC